MPQHDIHLAPFDAFGSDPNTPVGTAYAYAAVPKGVWNTYNIYEAVYPTPPPPPATRNCCEMYPLGVCAQYAVQLAPATSLWTARDAGASQAGRVRWLLFLCHCPPVPPHRAYTFP